MRWCVVIVVCCLLPLSLGGCLLLWEMSHPGEPDPVVPQHNPPCTLTDPSFHLTLVGANQYVGYGEDDDIDVAPGESVRVWLVAIAEPTCRLEGEDLPDLGYTWTATAGTVVGDGPDVTWTAPQGPVAVDLTCAFTYEGAERSLSAELSVLAH